MNTGCDFNQALSWITVNGGKVSLTLNGVERFYHQNENGDIICTPNGRSELAYKVKEFKIDAVLSNKWQLYTDEQFELDNGEINIEDEV